MKLVDYLELLRDAGLALVYPRGCALCGAIIENANDGATCAGCWSKTRIFTGDETACDKCGRLFENQTVKVAAKTFCRRCDQDFYDHARAIGVYDHALRVAVLELKEKPVVAPKLKNLIQQIVLRSPFLAASAIVPVPLHAKRLNERTFNQAAVLARVVADKAKLPLLENCLTRTVHTPMHRVGMDERARRESVEAAFAVKQPRLIKNETVLLVDDVFTTGATASRCAKTLKEAGADKVFVLTVARAGEGKQ